MKAVILLLCLVLLQISWAEVGHEVSEQLKNDAGEVLGRHVREEIQKPKKKKKEKKLRKGKKKTNANNKGNKKSKTRKNSKGEGRKSGKKNSKKPKTRKNGKGKGGKSGKKNSKKPKTRKSGKGKGRKSGKKNSKKPKTRKNGKGKGGKSEKKNSKKPKTRKSGKGKGGKSGKKNSKKPKTRKNGKGKGRKNGKKPKARKNGKKNSKKSKATENKRNKDKKEKQNNPKPSPDGRQTDECFTNLCAKSKKFNLYQTQMRKANRIQTWVDQMGKKKEKAITTFKNASNAIKSSTTNGVQCDGGAIPNDAKVADETLQLCNTTATEACSSSKISGLNTTLITECIPKLKSYVDAYKACLKTCECACFTALTLVDDSCTQFNDMDTNTKAAKKKCTSPSVKGSFGDCRTQERKVAYYGEKCKVCSTSMTTKAPSVIGRFLQQRKLQRHAGRM